MYNTIMLGTHIESIIASVMFNIELTFIADPMIMNKQYNKLNVITRFLPSPNKKVQAFCP